MGWAVGFRSRRRSGSDRTHRPRRHAGPVVAHPVRRGAPTRPDRARPRSGNLHELLLDEPTNHLDINHQLELLALVRRLPTTTIMALHDLNLAAMFCDSIVMLNRGSIVAHGSPTEVLTRRPDSRGLPGRRRGPLGRSRRSTYREIPSARAQIRRTRNCHSRESIATASRSRST